MTQQPLTWKLFGAFLLALVSVILALPFILLGAIWECVSQGFEVGRGMAIATGQWVKKQ